MRPSTCGTSATRWRAPRTSPPSRAGAASLMGATALITAAVAGPPRDTPAWVGLWLADAAVAVAHRPRRDGVEGAPHGHAADDRRRPPLRVRVPPGVGRRRGAHGGVRPRAPDDEAAGLLAAALRRGGHERRRIFRAARAGDGHLLHGARNARVRRASRARARSSWPPASAACRSASASSSRGDTVGRSVSSRQSAVGSRQVSRESAGRQEGRPSRRRSRSIG